MKGFNVVYFASTILYFSRIPFYPPKNVQTPNFPTNDTFVSTFYLNFKWALEFGSYVNFFIFLLQVKYFCEKISDDGLMIGQNLRYYFVEIVINYGYGLEVR